MSFRLAPLPSFALALTNLPLPSHEIHSMRSTVSTPPLSTRFALLTWFRVAACCVCTLGMAGTANIASAQRWNFPEPGVYKARIEPHWFADGASFWYRNQLRDDVKEFVVVDAAEGVRREAFDHKRLAESLGKALEKSIDGRQLPFNELEFSEDDQVVRFKVDGVNLACNLQSYSCWKVTEESEDASEAAAEDAPRGRGGRRPGRGRGPRGNNGGRSPDGRWQATVRDHNVVLKDNEASDGEDDSEITLTTDGAEDHQYRLLNWSPDSKTLVAFRVTPGDEKEVYLIESSPRGGGRAKLRTRPYALPGDKFATYELNVFRVDDHKQIKPDTDRLEMEWGTPEIRWRDGGAHFTYEQVDRGHQRYRLVNVVAASGEVRNTIDERTETFIWTAHTENVNMPHVTWLEHSPELIYSSERDGWRHLYLVDAVAGETKNQITKGEYVVRGIEKIDEANRQIWFRACGKEPNQDPYFIHYYRVNFDGTGLVALTAGDGNHSVQYSPDQKYLIDTFSRVDMPPVHELRRADDGSLVCKLEEADVAEAREGASPLPEPFVAKGRDGQTDIWGIICRPAKFDPNKKYPVIEQIYAGPQGSYVAKSFSARSRFSSLTDLGFIVVQIDGMGTANRSKAFHDVCWHNLKDAGFEDRILWMKSAAKKYPELDLDRVGVYGGSAGGQNACGALLFHGDFYKAAVAGCGCHDNRMDKASWNEQWMGYPVGPHYAESSNVDNAHRLQGKLMLILGELDDNVPIESTLRVVDALIKAKKDFDFVFVPGAGHGMGGEYGTRKMNDFFVKHLLNGESSSDDDKEEN
jgi:dipeptidyl aminopeptidase/acylaminoacyl peptidase